MKIELPPVAAQPMTDREVALLYGHEAFIGPCVHGRDPWDRCDICGEKTAIEAAVLVIAELEVKLRGAEGAMYVQEAFKKTAQTQLESAQETIRRVERILESNGCDCPCDHHWEDHEDECETCMACRVALAMEGP